MKKILLIVLFFTVWILADDKVITMGYKDREKMPLIGNEFDNKGLYYELFTKAAHNIGYKIDIERFPKKRLHFRFKKGVTDFYPGASFSLKRGEYLYYLPNGLETKEVLVTLDSPKEYKSLDELKGKLLIELGSSKSEITKKYPKIKTVQKTTLSMQSVINALQNKIADFYIADIEVVDYYKKQEGFYSYKNIGIKIHYNTINKEFIPMYLGFSRKSPLFSEGSNPYFDKTKGISIDNFPTKISKDCVAYKLYNSLMDLKKEGETKRLYNKYFK